MNLLAYAQVFAHDLKTGEIYKKPLDPREQIFHRAMGNLMDKAINSSVGLDMAGDVLLELLGSKQELAELKKKLEELQKPVEPAPEKQGEAATEQAEQAA